MDDSHILAVKTSFFLSSIFTFLNCCLLTTSFLNIVVLKPGPAPVAFPDGGRGTFGSLKEANIGGEYKELRNRNILSHMIYVLKILIDNRGLHSFE